MLLEIIPCLIAYKRKAAFEMGQLMNDIYLHRIMSTYMLINHTIYKEQDKYGQTKI